MNIFVLSQMFSTLKNIVIINLITTDINLVHVYAYF